MNSNLPAQTTHAAVAHGGDIVATAAKLGCRIAELTDLSSNLNPLGMPAGLRRLLTERLDEISYLPENGSESLRQLFAARHQRAPAEVLVGNGTTEFIFGVPQGLGVKTALIVNPTYGDYRLACDWAGLAVRSFALKPEEDFKLDFNRLALELTGGELVFICNPNNPTAVLTPTAEIHHLAGSHPKSLFLVDESYLPFTRESSLLEFPPLPNLLILSSYSKIYSIPGLRLGFLVASRENMIRLAARRRPWGVNRLAQIAGEFLLAGGEEFRQQVLAFLDEHRPAMATALAELPGVQVFPGSGNFILARLQARITVAELHQLLLYRHRIMIRNCSDFEGLTAAYFRISLKAGASMQLFPEAMRRILGT
jgi:histidinol-phosphate/aromatic aminotransferase/cobyric acid decarboxylase-like protein